MKNVNDTLLIEYDIPLYAEITKNQTNSLHFGKKYNASFNTYEAGWVFWASASEAVTLGC